ncbi:hypothetical protein RFI_30648 [Reticulomyxa filosa]|uniref:PIPK domain-containing protein n=1 Tax=Reticulomyxa filosa TaxID=46433 RepID=X6M180_RETFI|nr:hypothetical protein RFI_30648 [Reticulomyxa filosa]|eukprot:ETO06745.1 hypothetical protein RFI_30648 [Reticulomyxa filosa]
MKVGSVQVDEANADKATGTPAAELLFKFDDSGNHDGNINNRNNSNSNANAERVSTTSNDNLDLSKSMSIQEDQLVSSKPVFTPILPEVVSKPIRETVQNQSQNRVQENVRKDAFMDSKEENPFTSYYLDNIKAKPESRNRYCIRRFNITVKKKSGVMKANLQEHHHMQVPMEPDSSMTQTSAQIASGNMLRIPDILPPPEKKQKDEYDDLKAPFTDYCPHVFRYMRTKIYGINDRDYLSSVQQGTDEKHISDIVSKFSEGRSGALFFYTMDNKYIIKTVSQSEAQLLLNILPQYKEHMDMYRDSYLNKFLGLHSLKMYRLEIYFVVLANVFVPNFEPHEKYDLKGSWIDRHTNHHVELGL